MFGENEIDFVRGGGEGNHFFNYLLIVVLYPFRALDLLNIFTLFLPHLVSIYLLFLYVRDIVSVDIWMI